MIARLSRSYAAEVSSLTTADLTCQTWAYDISGPRKPAVRTAEIPFAQAGVRLVGLGRLARDARAVARRELGDRIPKDLRIVPRADRQHRGRRFSGGHEHVLGPGRRVEEVPRTQPPLLAVDDQDALAGEHEEPFLRVLFVVVTQHLAGLQDAHADAELRHRLGARVLEQGDVALRRVLGPRRVAHVDHEPALALGHEAGRPLL